MTTITPERTDRGFLVYSDEVREGSHAEYPTAWVHGEDLGLEQIRAWIREGHELENELKAFVAVVETDPTPRWLNWGEDESVEMHGSLEVGHVWYEHQFGTVHERKAADSRSWEISVDLHSDNDKAGKVATADNTNVGDWIECPILVDTGSLCYRYLEVLGVGKSSCLVRDGANDLEFQFDFNGDIFHVDAPDPHWQSQVLEKETR